jgi:cell division septation protein DedD
VSLAPVPSEQPGATPSCANCSAPLAPDQRYCLACGQPVSPVRLSFLDVLQAESPTPPPYGAGQSQLAVIPPGYASVIEPASGAYAWLRRYSGLFGLLSVLLLAIVAGLLVGHWVTQSKAPAQQVLRVEGLGGASATPLAATASTTAAPTTATTKTPAPAAPSSKAAAKTEAHEAQEAKMIEKAPPPKAVKVSPTKLHKLGSTTGKKHEEEVNSLGAQPIETGG